MPRVLIGVTLLLLLFYGVATLFRSALSDSVFQFDFALVHIIWGIGVVALSLAWVVWLVFSSRGGLFLSRVLPAMIVILAVGALVLYRPVFTGGMKISRWEPRFWNATTLTASADQRIEALAQPTEKDFSQFLGAGPKILNILGLRLARPWQLHANRR